MSSAGQDPVTPSDRMTLLQGPLGAILMLSGHQRAWRLSVLEHPLASRALGSPVHTAAVRPLGLGALFLVVRMTGAV
jgi:hypothetical protein